MTVRTKEENVYWAAGKNQKEAEKYVKELMPSEQMRKNNPKGAKANVEKKLKKRIGPKLFKEVQGNVAKADRDATIAYRHAGSDSIFEDKDPRMEAGKLRQFGSSRVPKKATGGTVRMKSGGPVVDSYDYS